MSTMSQKDANQVLRTAFDEATGSLKTVPNYVDTTVLVDAAPADSDFTSDPINVLPFKVTGTMISWEDLDQTDGSIQFEGSLDDVIYENVGSAVSLGTPDGQDGVSFIDEPYKYIRASYTHGTNTTGSITIKYIQRA